MMSFWVMSATIFSSASPSLGLLGATSIPRTSPSVKELSLYHTTQTILVWEITVHNIISPRQNSTKVHSLKFLAIVYFYLDIESMMYA